MLFKLKLHFKSKNIIDLFARVANDTIGEFDWTPYIPYVMKKHKKN